MFKVEYKYSACIKIVTDDARILCDPWFGDNAFLGAWGQYPKIDNPIDLLTYDWIHPRNQLVGTAEFVTEKIHELKPELNLQHLAIWSSPPGMPHDASMKSLKLFNEKVAPHFSDDKLIKKVS